MPTSLGVKKNTYIGQRRNHRGSFFKHFELIERISYLKMQLKQYVGENV